MKYAAIMRVRNEANIVGAWFDHYAPQVDAIYVFDDGSTDGTDEICEHRGATVVRREGERIVYSAQGAQRCQLAQMAEAEGAEWILCVDADEKLTLPRNVGADALYFRLFDRYATADPACDRKFGPEYRDIITAWHVDSALGITVREPILEPGVRLAYGGDCKHFSKARGATDWERKCARYTLPEYPAAFREKWAGRRGKYIHTESDFGRPLIRWQDRHVYGVPMGDE